MTKALTQVLNLIDNQIDTQICDKNIEQLLARLSMPAQNDLNQDFKEMIENPTDDLLEQADIYID